MSQAIVFDDGRYNGRTLREWLPEAVERTVQRFDPVRVVLFGSLADGTEDRDSDIDLLVVPDEVEDKRASMLELQRATSDFPAPLDLIPTDPARSSAAAIWWAPSSAPPSATAACSMSEPDGAAATGRQWWRYADSHGSCLMAGLGRVPTTTSSGRRPGPSAVDIPTPQPTRPRRTPSEPSLWLGRSWPLCRATSSVSAS